jgi:hypothetical protein
VPQRSGLSTAVSDHMVPLSTLSKLGGADVIKSVLDGSPMQTLKTVKYNYVINISLYGHDDFTVISI